MKSWVMPVTFDPDSRTFHLTTPSSSYLFRIGPWNRLIHLGWGPRIGVWRGGSAPRSVDRPFSANPDPADRTLSLDTLPQEFPTAGGSDFRRPALRLRHADGAWQAELAYDGHRILPGKPPLSGLPCSYVETFDEADTLEIDLVDSASSLAVTLSYSVYRQRDALVRSVRVRNGGKTNIELLSVQSVSVDFADRNFDLLTLPGAWGRERAIERRSLRSGFQGVESRRGASSHQQHPFLTLLRPGSDERSGEVYGLSLVYSGNFAAGAEVDQFEGTRVQLGINPEGFSWCLEPGAEFQAPEVLMVRSGQGLGGMSRTFHKLLGQRVARGPWRDRDRPVLINTREAASSTFDAGKLLDIADEAARIGIELFVLDDGTSLGDWVSDRQKLPAGLDDLGSRLLDRGLTFGLWFEPEMVSADSDLYRAHPDWGLQVPGRPRSEGRNQLVLDLGRPEVQDHIVEAVSVILKEVPLSYVKWDMNRHHTEAGSAALPPDRQGETNHRFMLGLYSVLERITSRFPAVLFESCSGGGGRFDPGLLFYMPQSWTSDNTDPLGRLEIQYGTSLVYPPASMGAHVSAAPNPLVQRWTPLRTRYDVARTGAFGYELDLTQSPRDEKEEMKRQVAEFKEDRRLLQFGDFYRLLSPFDGPFAAWMSVSDDQRDAVVTFVKALARPTAPQTVLKLAGLNPDQIYTIDGRPGCWSGEELMGWGYRLPDLAGDFASLSLRLRPLEVEPSDSSIRRRAW
jgi:alpha-galactosidase